MLNNLGALLQSPHTCTGMMEDLEMAIRVAQQAVDVTSNDYLDFLGRLSNLGNKLPSR